MGELRGRRDGFGRGQPSGLAGYPRAGQEGRPDHNEREQGDTAGSKKNAPKLHTEDPITARGYGATVKPSL